MTEKQKFIDYLKKHGYRGLDNGPLFVADRIPHCYITETKDHILSYTNNVCIWGGSNVKSGDLGCVTFYLGGSLRKYCCRKTEPYAELLKKIFIPKTASEAIKELDEYYKTTATTLSKYKLIM